MNIIGIRILSTPAADPIAGREPGPRAFAGVSDAPGPSFSDFEAGMIEASRASISSDGPPLWDRRELAEALARGASPEHEADDPLGNPHPVGSDAWSDFGRKTGVWFTINPQLFAWAQSEFRKMENHGFDSKTARERWHLFMKSYGTQIARLSDVMSRAARAGASDAQLQVTADAALERGHIGQGKKGDFEKAWRDPQSDLRFGNIHGGSSMVLGDNKRHVLRVGARHMLAKMGDQAVDAVEQQAREMGLDLYESDDRASERAGAGLAAFFQRHQLELAHLRSRDPQAWARLHERRRELVEAAEAREARSDADPAKTMRSAAPTL